MTDRFMCLTWANILWRNSWQIPCCPGGRGPFEVKRVEQKCEADYLSADRRKGYFPLSLQHTSDFRLRIYWWEVHYVIRRLLSFSVYVSKWWSGSLKTLSQKQEICERFKLFYWLHIQGILRRNEGYNGSKFWYEYKYSYISFESNST